MAGTHNIVVTKGDTFNFNFRIETNGVAWDLTTYTGRMQVRESEISSDYFFDVPADGTIVMTNEGHVSISVPAAKMATVPVGRWFYDFEVTSAGGEKETILAGRFIVGAEVTA